MTSNNEIRVKTEGNFLVSKMFLSLLSFQLIIFSVNNKQLLYTNSNCFNGLLNTDILFMTQTLSQQDLERHLWGAADILRGKIDSSDYKHYIFGLLFFKRLSDVWEEEYEARLAEFGVEEMAADASMHRFHIPEGAFWKDVRTKTTDIGTELNAAFHAIEDANPKLLGIFQDVDFNNKKRFPDETLELLLQHFDTYRLRNAEVTADMLGNAYEYLIAQFADDAGKKGGEFYTPKEVVRLIVEVLQPEAGMSIYDPTCGSGGMLLESVRHLERKGQSTRGVQLYGQEMNLNTWAICKMNLFLHDIEDAEIAYGDTLRNPQLTVGESKTLQQFDRVIANPPFSLKSWGHELWKDGDSYSRDKYGCPPKSYGDLAFVQHMVASLKPEGRMGVVLPHGILFRGGAEGKIRQGLLQADMVEGVIGLANNLFYGTGIPACVLVINKNKPAERKGKLVIVNGDKDFKEGKNQNSLTEANVTRLVQGFAAFADEKLFAKVVTLGEVAENDWNLNIARYVDTTPPPEPIDTAAELRKLKKLTAKRDEAEATMMRYLEELRYE